MRIYLIILFGLYQHLVAQDNTQSFIIGEELEYRVHYGLLEAGRSTISVEGHTGAEYKFRAYGKSTGLFNFFFKVRDYYESIVNKECLCPVYFHRDVKEGNYTKTENVYFNYLEKEIQSTRDTITLGEYSADILSSFYQLREHHIDSLYLGYAIPVEIYLDDELMNSQIEYLGMDTLRTKFGKISCQVWSPVLETGRIFKNKHGMKIWVSDDSNRIPVRLESEILIGSIKMDLISYKNLANPLTIITD